MTVLCAAIFSPARTQRRNLSHFAETHMNRSRFSRLIQFRFSEFLSPFEALVVLFDFLSRRFLDDDDDDALLCVCTMLMITYIWLKKQPAEPYEATQIFFTDGIWKLIWSEVGFRKCVLRFPMSIGQFKFLVVKLTSLYDNFIFGRGSSDDDRESLAKRKLF